MRTLAPARGDGILRELIRSRGDTAPYYELVMDDLHLLDRIEVIEWGAQDGAVPTLLLEATLSGRIPDEYQNAPVHFSVDFGGFRIVEMEAVESRLEWEQDKWVTKLRAVTPGARLDKTALKSFTEYPNQPPEWVIRDALYRVPYDRGRVYVEPFGRPLINRAGNGTDGGFSERDHPASVLSVALATVSGVMVDTARRGVRCFADPGLGAGAPVAWHYDVPETLAWTPPVLASPDDQYTEVIVAHENTGQPGRVYASAKVDYSGSRYPPRAEQPLYITLTDTGPNAAVNAQELAYKNASAAASGTHQGGVTLPYNPYLEKYDTVTFSENRRDDSGLVRREWRAVATGAVRHHAEFGKAPVTILNAPTMTLVSRKRVRESIVLPGVAAGSKGGSVVPTPVLVPRPGLYPSPGLMPGPL